MQTLKLHDKAIWDSDSDSRACVCHKEHQTSSCLCFE